MPAFAYLGWFNWVCIVGDGLCRPAGTPFGLSFANIFAFFGLHRLYFAEELRALPAFLQFLAGAQTVLGFLFLFLLGLGLRNRFRLR